MANELLSSWLAEKRSAYLYQELASKERNTPRAFLFKRLGEEAENQALIWQQQIEKRGEIIPQTLALDLRTKIVARLIRSLGPKAIRTVLAATKIRGLSIYTDTLPNHSTPTSIEQIGQRHRKRGSSGNLRAAVFGINDGLVSNAALICGMTGVSSHDPYVVLYAGISGLLAGAFSMAAGEYISVRSQREMFEYQISLEAEELKLYPQEEAAELALIFHARGIEKSEAKILADKLIKDPVQALDTLAKEELGLDPADLGSPGQAAIASFASFTIGALIPLLPFFCMSNTKAFNWTIALSAVSLLGIGAVISLFTGRSAWLGGLRMLTIGGLAGALTYVIGHYIGS